MCLPQVTSLFRLTKLISSSYLLGIFFFLMLIISNRISFHLASVMKLLHSISRTGKLQFMVQISPAVHFYKWYFIGKQSHPFITYWLQLSCYSDGVKRSLQKLYGSQNLKYLVLNSLQTHTNVLTLFYGNLSCPSRLPFWTIHLTINTGIVLGSLQALYLAQSLAELASTEHFIVICFTQNHKI